MTILLIVVGLFGRADLAAELGIVQGALLATFYAFSANTRSLILQGHTDLTPDRLLSKRILAVPVLALASYLLCVNVAGIAPALATALILRRAFEWLAEIRLCELEVASDAMAARKVLIVQGVATALAAIGLVFMPELGLVALYAFALAPLVGSTPKADRSAFELSRLRATLKGITPHIGSTAIVGISVYILRLMVFLLVDAHAAGLFFTAFALGSFTATLFANVLGPTLALRRARTGQRGSGRLVRSGIAALVVAGVFVTAAAGVGAPEMLGKPTYFWLALGLSMLGAAVMIRALLIRLDLFDREEGDLLFGPDVLRNLTLLLAVPAAYRLVGSQTLSGVYLMDATLALFFYASVKWARVGTAPSEGKQVLLRAGIAAGLLFPLFFQLQGRIFFNPGPLMIDSGGSILNVPLPMSLLVVFFGTLMLARYREATLAFGFIFFLFAGMVFTTILAGHGSGDIEARKLLLLFQYLVPAFALVLGQMYGAGDHAVQQCAKAFLGVLSVVVPLQLGLSIGHGENAFVYHVLIFTVYQHRQFVPVVFVGAFLLATFVLWDDPRHRSWILTMAPIMGGYAAVSYSTLALGFLVGGLCVLAVARARIVAAHLCLVLAVAAAAAYLYLDRGGLAFQTKYGGLQSAQPEHPAAPPDATAASPERADPGHLQMPLNVKMRLDDWALYGNGIVESWRTAMFGHAKAFDRAVSTSAHNYYLDFVYNFGLVALLPMIWLIAYTAALLWGARGGVRWDLPLLGLVIVAIFLVVIDNNFKVTFRQPYPGLFGFFLWGLLLSRLTCSSRAV